MEHSPKCGSVAQVSEEIIGKVARDLSLGLDCNVPVMACEEAVALLFSELRKDAWLIVPPER